MIYNIMDSAVGLWVGTGILHINNVYYRLDVYKSKSLAQHYITCYNDALSMSMEGFDIQAYISKIEKALQCWSDRDILLNCSPNTYVIECDLQFLRTAIEKLFPNTFFCWKI